MNNRRLYWMTRVLMLAVLAVASGRTFAADEKLSEAELLEKVQSINPAPYAELVSDRLCISLPSKHVRKLDNPTEQMEFWDSIVADHDELAGHAYLRNFADRINIDVQISIGAAHSGYPIQGYSLWNIVDLEQLRETGSWGWFHELGHEAQSRPDKAWGPNNYYAFDGSIECTVNIYSTHARDMHGIKSPGGWGWTSYPIKVMQKALSVAEDPAKNYAGVGVGTKLAMCLQLRDAFGWETWQEVLRGYNRDYDKGVIEGKWSDQRKRDELLFRFSRASGHDLTRWFTECWGVEASDEAVAKVAELGLPSWMPAIGGIDGVQTVEGGEKEFDLAGNVLSMDGVAEIVNVTQPEHGKLTEKREGLWVYTPKPGYSGKDSFTYSVKSSTGHIATSTIRPG